MICQACGVEAETRYVSYHQNIGALLIRFPRSVEGHLCKACIHTYFWQMTITTFVLGWWGVISFIVTPFLLLNNVVRYLFCIGMEPVAPGATRPRLTEDAIERITPHAPDLFSRLNDGEEFARVAPLIAERADVTPGQIALFVHAVMQAQSQE